VRKGLIMGVVNITPDSFSDGGLYLSLPEALRHIDQLILDGADIIDLGAETTRPGARPVALEEEWARLQPVLDHLARGSYPALVSVDTYKPDVMRRLDDYPVAIINDVRGGADQETLERLALQNKIYLAMHMHGTPETMQQQALDGPTALSEISRFYRETRERLLRAGFKWENIWLDPGIGFGKSDQANLQLIRQAIGRAQDEPVVLGISRKSFLGRLLDLEIPETRDAPSKMLELAFLMAGVQAIRTHDVRRLKRIRDLLA
jgi:dihydropteroate synthase